LWLFHGFTPSANSSSISRKRLAKKKDEYTFKRSAFGFHKEKEAVKEGDYVEYSKDYECFPEVSVL